MWEQERNGKLYLCERICEPLTGKSRTITVKIAKNTQQARKEALRKLQDKIDAGTQTRIHLSELIERYKAEQIRTVRESTYVRNSYSLQTMLDLLDDVYVDALTAGYIRNKLIQSGKENRTMNELVKRFKAFLRWAYQNDYISREVPDKLQYFQDQTTREKVADKYLEKDELKALIDAFDIERWALLSSFLALSGLRIGEAIALNNDDVTAEYISVTKSFNEGLSSMGETKTDSSNREVYIQPELAECIRKIRICMKKQRMMYGYEDRGFFFTGIDGGRIGYASYKKQLKIAAEKAGIKKNVTPHILRHTMTSLFAEAGVQLEVISRRLGHENSDITREVYLHITKTRRQMDNDAIRGVTLLA